MILTHVDLIEKLLKYVNTPDLAHWRQYEFRTGRPNTPPS